MLIFTMNINTKVNTKKRLSYKLTMQSMALLGKCIPLAESDKDTQCEQDIEPIKQSIMLL